MMGTQGEPGSGEEKSFSSFNRICCNLYVFVVSGKILSILISLLNKHFCKQSVQIPRVGSPGSTCRMEGGKKTYWSSKEIS